MSPTFLTNGTTSHPSTLDSPAPHNASAPRIPSSGIWVPCLTFFHPSTDTLDLQSQALYFRHLSLSGLHGLLILGTNAETLLLTREERAALIRCARHAVGPDYPLMVGISGHSVTQCKQYIQDAEQEGADYLLALPAAYFGNQTTPAVVKSFFEDVCKIATKPVVIYNFPLVCNGVDLSSEDISGLVKSTGGKIVGVKLTCGSVAKITRLAGEFSAGEFAPFGGQSDFLLGGMASGSSGTIAAFGNLFPKVLVRIYDLWVAGNHKEALALHKIAARAEAAGKSGIAAIKYACSQFGARRVEGIVLEGLEERLAPRRPYTMADEKAREFIRERMAECAELEDRLWAESRIGGLKN